METEGPAAFAEISETLQDLVDGGNPLAVYDIQGFDGRLLSDLVDALQSAEARSKAKATKMSRALGVTLRDIGKVLAKTVLAAFAV